jgi:hypothetical protein
MTTLSTVTVVAFPFAAAASQHSCHGKLRGYLKRAPEGLKQASCRRFNHQGGHWCGAANARMARCWPRRENEPVGVPLPASIDNVALFGE